MKQEEQKRLEQIVQEAQLLKALQSTHIIRYHEFIAEGRTFYIVMEYAPNGTLTDKIKVWIFLLACFSNRYISYSYICKSRPLSRKWTYGG